MAKKKSVIKEVVETVESWVGMGPKAVPTRKTTNVLDPTNTLKIPNKKSAKKGNLKPATKKKTVKKSGKKSSKKKR